MKYLISGILSCLIPLNLNPQENKEWDPKTAVEFIMKNQKKDGTWDIGFELYLDSANGITVGTTAIACLALVEYRDSNPDKIAESVNKGLDACLKLVYKKEKSARDYESTAWGQLYTLKLLCELVKHPALKDKKKKHVELAEETLEWFYKRQNKSGSWGYETSFQTAAAILMLSELKDCGIKVSEDRVKKAVEFLKGIKSKHGYRYASAQTKEKYEKMGENKALDDSAGRIAACALALYKHGEITKEELETSVKQFIEHRKFLWEAKEIASRGEISRNDCG